MTSEDDDDPQLRSLRAVWVSMRDEEPSDRGLASLMSAARAQAEHMQPRPRFWERVLVTLRRPPVLALASATVLLGGALFVAQRQDKLAAPSEVSQASAPAPEEAGDLSLVRPSAVPSGEASQPESTEGDAAVPTRVEHAEPSPPVTPGTPRRRARAEAMVERAVAKDAAKKAESQREVATVTGAERQAVASPAVLAESKPSPNAGAPRYESEATSLSVASDAELDASTVKPSKRPIARQAPPPIEGADRGASAGAGAAPEKASPKAPTIAQLVQQADAAAARGDCAAVRTLAARIAKTDPGTYKTRVRGNAAIARCLD